RHQHGGVLEAPLALLAKAGHPELPLVAFAVVVAQVSGHAFSKAFRVRGSPRGGDRTRRSSGPVAHAVYWRGCVRKAGHRPTRPTSTRCRPETTQGAGVGGANSRGPGKATG